MVTCDMGPRSLSSPRLIAFAIIAACYLLITIHITSNITHSSCDKSPEPSEGGASDTGTKNENDRIIHLQKPYFEDDSEEEVAKKGKSIVKIPDDKRGPLGKTASENGKKKATHKTVTEKPVKKYIPDIHPPDVLLDTDLNTNMVYYVWCGRRWFEFSHYLSVLSVIKNLKPDNIFFYYDSHPIRDNWIYNTWFDELKQEYPFFHVELVSAEEHACVAHNKANITFINKLLTTTGGLFMSEYTILDDFPLDIRKLDFAYGLENQPLVNIVGFISAKRGIPGGAAASTVLRDTKLKTRRLKCVSAKDYKAADKPMCYHVTERIFPKDFWDTDSDLARSVRTLFYGVSEPQDATPSYDELIPNIAHIVWIGGGKMDYLFYLGVLSLIYVAEVDTVYIHGNAPPSGPLWDRVKDHEKLKIIYREAPRTVYDTGVRIISHVTDVWRVDFMVRYGGIYVDTDTVWINKLDDEIRGYDAVGSYDWTYWNHPFPDTINFGVAIGKRNAKFWQEFQKSMKWFIDSDWSWNGLRQPYRIKERQPTLLKINPRLQVICFEFKCHPTWWPNYHNESIHHLNSPSIKDWRKDVYAFHWTLPTPPELDDEAKLLTTDTMAGEVGRFVLEKAGLLEKIKELHINKNKNVDLRSLR